jgi:hypothetical protein
MTGFWAELAGRDSGPVLQFIKYALCGGVATAVDMAVFFGIGVARAARAARIDPSSAVLRLKVRLSMNRAGRCASSSTAPSPFSSRT